MASIPTQHKPRHRCAVLLLSSGLAARAEIWGKPPPGVTTQECKHPWPAQDDLPHAHTQICMVRRYQSGGMLRQLTPTRVAAASRRALSSDLAAALGGGPAAAPMTSGAGGTGRDIVRVNASNPEKNHRQPCNRSRLRHDVVDVKVEKSSGLCGRAARHARGRAACSTRDVTATRAHGEGALVRGQETHLAKRARA